MRFLLRHWELKLLALAVATALWLFVATSEKSDLFVEAPVELYGVPPGLEVVGEGPAHVEVQLQGLRGVLARLAPNHVRARVSLAGANVGEVALRLLPEHIIVPPGVKVIRVNPVRLRVTLAQSRSSLLPTGPAPSAGRRDAGARA